jgi:hypothetical protein
MDLANLKPKSEVTEILLKHPNTLEPLPNEDGSEMSVTVALPHSKRYKVAMHDQQNRRINAVQKKGSMNYTAEDLERDSIELLAKITENWDITYNNEKPKLTVAKAKEVYSEVFWLRDQIEEALTESLDFTKA